MRYKRIYEILNERKRGVPGFADEDRSGWKRKDCGAWITPLWICAEVRSVGYRVWVTQSSASALHISYVKLDRRGRRADKEQHIRCRSRAELTARLERLFAEWDADKRNGEEGAMAA